MKTLLETLNSNSMTMSRSDIEAIMYEELDKDPQDMDVELIELCAKVLDGTYPQPVPQKSIRKNILRKALVTAAALIISVGIAFPVAAKYVHNETFNNIVQYVSGHFNLDLSKGKQTAINHSDTKNALVKKLEDIGYENIILPSIFLEQNYSDDDIQVITNDDLFLCVQINFKLDKNIYGYLDITKHKTQSTKNMLGQTEKSSQYDSANQYSINGIDIIIFSSSTDNISSIKYIDDSTEYSFTLENCTLETAIKIIETLKQ